MNEVGRPFLRLGTEPSIQCLAITSIPPSGWRAAIGYFKVSAMRKRRFSVAGSFHGSVRSLGDEGQCQT